MKAVLVELVGVVLVEPVGVDLFEWVIGVEEPVEVLLCQNWIVVVEVLGGLQQLLWWSCLVQIGLPILGSRSIGEMPQCGTCPCLGWAEGPEDLGLVNCE